MSYAAAQDFEAYNADSALTTDIPAEPAFSDSGNTGWQPRLGIDVGSSVFGRNGNFFSREYFRPALHVNPTDKWHFSAGTSVQFTQTNMSFLQNHSEDISDAGYFEKMASYQMFASGNYRVNENFSLHGSMAVEYYPGSEFEASKYGRFGFDLKLSEEAWIHTDFQFAEINNPYSGLMYRGMQPRFGGGFSDYRFGFPQW